VSRIPIRLRLTLVFAVAMAVVIAVGGGVTRLLVGRALDSSIDDDLRGRLGDITTLVSKTNLTTLPSGKSPLAEQGETLAQVVDARGRVLDAVPPLRVPLITGASLSMALRTEVTVDRTRLAGVRGSVRVTAAPVTVAGRRLVVAVAASLRERDRTLGSIDLLILVGGPIALVIASVAGYAVAAAALRPVEDMRRRAEAVSGDPRGERLPVPAARDEIHGLAATLNRMLDRIDAAMRRQRSFVADASHELRTPLAILTSELELARIPSATPEDLRAAIDSAAEETDRLVAIADDLLVIARGDDGALATGAEPVDPSDLVGRVASRFAVRAQEDGRAVVPRVEHGLPAWHLDAAGTEQALCNLVENALRHGAGTITVGAGAAPDGSRELWVADQGPGMPAEFVDRAFDRFSRADSARGRPGSGLGLAIVKGIVQAQGAGVRIEQRPTEFRVVLSFPGDRAG
jgi:signal transduction histidine kinase